MEIKEHLDIIDYIVFCLIILITILIGFYHGYKHKLSQMFNQKLSKNEDSNFLKNTNNENKTVEYLNANASMNVFPITMSLLGTCFSATALVG